MPTSTTKPSLTAIQQPKLAVDYQNLFETLPSRYIVVATDDPAFTIIAQNEAHANGAYVKIKDVLGKPVFEVFPDTSDKFRTTGVNDLLESFRKVIKTGKPDTMPSLRYDLKRQDGSIATKYWRVTHYPLFQGTGKSKQLYAIYQATEDITESMAADQRLNRTERTLDEVLSAGLIGTWVWDISANTVIGDKYMADMFGVSVEAAAEGLPLEAFIKGVNTEDRPRVEHDINTALASADTFESEYRTINREGAIRWVIARGRIERDGQGKPVNFPGVLVDITERKLIENNLSFLSRASTTLSTSLDYRMTMQTIAELMVPDIADWCTVDMLNEDNQLQLVALAHKDPDKIAWARKLRDKQGPPDMNQPGGIANVIHSGKLEYIPRITDEILVASAKSKTELKLLRELSFTSVMIVPLNVDGKTIGAITMITTDKKREYTPADTAMANELANRASLAISNAKLYDKAQHELRERTRLEEELRIANEDLEHRVDLRTNELEQSNASLQRSNQELQDFAYVASHDLQEPLRKIQAFGNLLETEYSQQLGEGKDYLVRMRNAAARMSILIDDILSFSRVTTKGREFSTVNLKTITQEVMSDLEVRISESKAIIKIGDLPTLHADAMQMRQLLQNLIANALKFHREGVPPEITLRSTTKILPDKTKVCRLEVVDNGLGFDEKYLGRIFAVFQRLHSREDYEGTGIGLAVCRKIVERHGGAITARSKPGVGSTFIITLPLRHRKGESLL